MQTLFKGTMLKVLSGLVLIGCVYGQYRGQVDNSKYAGKYVYDLLRPALQPVEVAAIEASRGADSYPTLSCIPPTPFQCSSKNGPGFYADADAAAGCQVFHRCDLNGNVTDYLCVNSTLFNQITLVCDSWFNVDCGRSLEFEDFANRRLYTNQPLFDTPPVGYIAPSQAVATTVNVASQWHPSSRSASCQQGPAPRALDVVPPPVNQVTDLGTGTGSGIITNALTGLGEADVMIIIRVGAPDITYGKVKTVVTSGADGTYSVTLPNGNYTAQLSKPGFVTSYITIYIIAGQVKDNQEGVISPTLPPGQTRVILTWGATPPDLDAHMTGPGADAHRWHVFYSARGSTTGPPFTTLDVDRQKGYGPETITIEKQFDGVYRYSVLDYTDLRVTTGSPLANSSATVKILRGNEMLNTFTVPNEPGNLWTVFELNGDKVTPVNTMGYQNVAAGVTK